MAHIRELEIGPIIDLSPIPADITKQLIDRQSHEEVSRREEWDTVQVFRDKEFKSVADLRNYTAELYKKCNDENEASFLRQLSKVNDEVFSFDQLCGAIETYLRFKEIEKQLANLLQEIQRHTFLNRQLEKKHSQFNKVRTHLSNSIEDVREQIGSNCIDLDTARKRAAAKSNKRTMTDSQLISTYFSCSFASGKSFVLGEADKALKLFQDQKNIEKQRLTFNYPGSYHKIGYFKQPNEDKNQVNIQVLLNRVKALFDDYFKGRFHWVHWGRHYRTLAESIATRLQDIINSPDNPDKIAAAIKLISDEENKMGVGKSLSDKKASSFFRRAHFAVGLLDDAKVTLENPQQRSSVKARAL